jgi:tetratricopeptide (TPR) repeat protein
VPTGRQRPDRPDRGKAMGEWKPFPYAGEYPFDADRVRRFWSRLHAGDAEPLPSDARVLEAWALFHSGEFRKAVDLGLKLGGSGITVANKAACVYATYLEHREQARRDLFLEVAARAEAQVKADPDNINAYFWQAYALGRYAQGLSVSQAMAQGVGSRIKQSLEHVIAREPRHVDAHIALGAFHAEVIDKVGSLIGSMTFGARKDTGMDLFAKALRLNFESAVGMVEYANAMMLLEGEKMMKEAARLYQRAAGTEPIDALERLDVELARQGLDN